MTRFANIPGSFTAEQVESAAAACYDGHYDRDPDLGRPPVPRFETLSPQIKEIWMGTARGLLAWMISEFGEPESEAASEGSLDSGTRIRLIMDELEDLKSRMRYPKQVNDILRIQRLVMGPPAIEFEAPQLPEI